MSTKKKAVKPNKEYKPKSEYSKLESIPSGTNNRLTSPNNAFMRSLLGEPRKNKDYTQDDKGLDNKELEDRHKTDDVGPFKVTGLALAVDDLKGIMRVVEKELPDLYKRLGHDGMRNVRYQRGSSEKISNHAWGTAIDLMIDCLRDPYKDGKTQHGLSLMVPIFNNNGWYWGGAYKPKKDKNGNLKCNEDAMHFEVGKKKLLGWAQLGYLGPDAQKYALENETIKLINAKKPAKIKEELTASTFFRQSPKQANKAVATKELPQSSFFRAPLPRRPGESWPNWFGRTTKSWARIAGTWFR